MNLLLMEQVKVCISLCSASWARRPMEVAGFVIEASSRPGEVSAEQQVRDHVRERDLAEAVAIGLRHVNERLPLMATFNCVEERDLSQAGVPCGAHGSEASARAAIVRCSSTRGRIVTYRSPRDLKRGAQRSGGPPHWQ